MDKFVGPICNSKLIFHIFHDDLRTTYSLEELWSDASRLELDFLNAE